MLTAVYGIATANAGQVAKQTIETALDFVTTGACIGREQCAVCVLQFTGLETAEGSQVSQTGEEFTPPSGHSRSFGQWGSNNSRTSRPRPGPSRYADQAHTPLAPPFPAYPFSFPSRLPIPL